jgi:hypothetical protein
MGTGLTGPLCAMSVGAGGLVCRGGNGGNRKRVAAAMRTTTSGDERQHGICHAVTTTIIIVVHRRGAKDDQSGTKPMICRGTHARVVAMERAVDAFLSLDAPPSSSLSPSS